MATETHSIRRKLASREGVSIALSLFGLAVAVPIFLLALDISSWQPLALIIVLVAAGAISGLLEDVLLTSKVSLGFAYLTFIVAAVIFGPATAAVITVAEEVCYRLGLFILKRSKRFSDRLPKWRMSGALITACSTVWAALAAGFLYNALQGAGSIKTTDLVFYAAMATAGIVLVVINYLGVGGLLSIRDHVPFKERVNSEYITYLPIHTLIIASSALALVLYHYLGLMALSIFAVLSPLTAHLIRRSVEWQKIKRTVEQNSWQLAKLKAKEMAAEIAQMKSIPENYEICDTKVEYNHYGHPLSAIGCKKAAIYAHKLALQYGLDEEIADLSYVCAMAHAADQHNFYKAFFNSALQTAKGMGVGRWHVSQMEKLAPDMDKEEFRRFHLDAKIHCRTLNKEGNSKELIGLALVYQSFLEQEPSAKKKNPEEQIDRFFDYVRTHINLMHWYEHGLDHLAEQDIDYAILQKEKLSPTFVDALAAPDLSPAARGCLNEKAAQYIAEPIEKGLLPHIYEEELPKAMKRARQARSGRRPVGVGAVEPVGIG